MPASFDPYAAWLGLREGMRSPNYYELLGLSPLESRAETIRSSAEARLTAVQLHASGPNAAIAQQLLQQLQRARDCLLNPQTKAAYDARLRGQTPAAAPVEAPLPTPASSVAKADLFDSVAETTDASVRLAPRPQAEVEKSGGALLLAVVLGALAACLLLAVGGGAAWWLLRETAPAVVTVEEAPVAEAPQATVAPRTAGDFAAPPVNTPVAARPVVRTTPVNPPAAEMSAETRAAQKRHQILNGRVHRRTLADASISPSMTPRTDERLESFLASWEVQSDDYRRANFQLLVGYQLLEKLEQLLEQDRLEPVHIEALLDDQVAMNVAGRTMFTRPRLAIPMCVQQYGHALAPSGQYTLQWLWEETETRIREGDVHPRPAATVAKNPRPTVSTAADAPQENHAASDEVVRYNPSSFELPPIVVLDDRPEVRLGPIDAGDDIALQLVCEAATARKSRTFEIEPAEKPSPTQRSWIVYSGPATQAVDNEALAAGAERVSVAELVHRDGDLHFRWTEGAAAGSGNDLRNCVLGISSGGNTTWHRLRGPRIMWPAVLDLDSTLTSYPLPAKTYLPEPASMMLELTGLKGFPADSQVIPESRVITPREPLRIVLRQTQPKAEVRVSLFAAGPRTVVRVEPVVVDVDDKTTIPFTTSRINQMNQTLPGEIAAAQRELSALRDAIPDIESELRSVSARQPNNLTEQNDKARTLARLNQLLGQRRRRYQDLSKLVPQMQRRLEILPGLADLGNMVNRAAEMQFRVFFQCDDQQVEAMVADAALVPKSDYELLRGLNRWTVNNNLLEGEIAFMETTGGKSPGAASDNANFSALKSIVVTMRLADGSVSKFNSELFDGPSRNLLQQIWDRRTQLSRDDVFRYAADGIALAASAKVRQACNELRVYLNTGSPLAAFRSDELFRDVAVLLLAAETHLPPEFAAVVRDSVNYDLYNQSPHREGANYLRARIEEVKEQLKSIVTSSTDLQDELRRLYRRYTS